MHLLFKQAKVLLKIAFTSATLTALLLSVGCAGTTYRDKSLDAPGAPAPAMLVRNFSTFDFMLLNVDDHRHSGKRAELLPGEHTVTVGLNEGLYRGTRLRIHFEAKSGETYQLDAKLHEKFLTGSWQAWITEVSTGKRFDGEPIDLH